MLSGSISTFARRDYDYLRIEYEYHNNTITVGRSQQCQHVPAQHAGTRYRHNCRNVVTIQELLRIEGWSRAKQLHWRGHWLCWEQSRRGVTAIHVAPEGDVITDCDALRTTEDTEEEREGGHDEHSLRGGRSPLGDPLR